MSLTERLSFDRHLLFLLLYSLIILLFLVWPIIELGTSHLRVVEAFNVDEGEFLWPIGEAFRRGDFNIGRYDYGLLYYNMGLLICFILSIFIDVNDQVLIQVLRAESFVFLVMSALLIYDWVKRNSSALLGVASGLSLLTFSITLVNYGSMLHPDLCQMFFILLGLYALDRAVECDSFKWWIFSSVAAGLAFSSKYAGIALIPLIWGLGFYQAKRMIENKWVKSLLLTAWLISVFCAIVFDRSWIESFITQEAEMVQTVLNAVSVLRILSILSSLLLLASLIIKPLSGRLKEIGQILSLWIVSGGAFFISFLLGSPQSVYKFNFLNGLIYVTNLHKEGHWFKNEEGLMGWWRIISQKDVLGWWWVLLALLAFSWILKRINSEKARWRFSIPMLWLGIFLLVVVFRVKSKFAHYLIPIIPVFVLYTWLGLAELAKRVPREFGKRLQQITLLVILMLGSFHLWTYQKIRIQQFENSAAIKAGEWLDENVQEEVFILADKYTYVPAKSNIQTVSVFGIVSDHLVQFDPDYLVIQERVYERFMHPEKADVYLYGKEVYLNRYRIYTELLNNEFHGYTLEEDFGEVKVYKKKRPKS